MSVPSKSDLANKTQSLLDDASLLYLLEGDELFSSELILILERENYQVRSFTGLSDFESACETEMPAVIVIDFVRNDSAALITEAVSRLTAKFEVCPPLVFISASDDVEERLAVARVGAHHYFCRPLDTNKFIHTLDSLSVPSSIKPYRVLLIDDDETSLQLHANMLREAGMDVETLSDPLLCLKVIRKFNPDILITDSHMSKCTGAELLQVIWQDDALAGMPVILLTDELKPERQLARMATGCENFLIKPVQADDLVEFVIARINASCWFCRHNKDLDAASEEKELKLLAMDQHEIVSITDVAGRIIMANDRFCEASGYNRDELLGKSHSMLKSGIHPRAFYEEMWRTISQGKVWRGEICNRRKDGYEYWVDATIIPFMNNKGKPYKYVSFRTDITKLRQSEERLHRSQAFANIGNWDWDLVTGSLFWSEQIGPLFGYAEGELDTSYESFLNAVHPEDRQEVVDAVNSCMEHGEAYHIEHRVVWPDGSVHWVLERGDVIRSEAGKVLHMIGVVQDITKRKNTELALVAKEQLLREAQALAKIGNWHADLTSGKLIWSDDIYRIFGYEPGSFEPSVEAFKKTVHPDDLAMVEASEKLAEQTGRHDIIHRIVRPDGSVRHVHELAQAETDKTGKLLRLVGTVQDITELVESELRLRETEDRFAFAVEGAGDGVWDWDMCTDAMQFSSLYMEMLGYVENELPCHVDTWVDSLHHNDVAYVQQNLQDYLKGLKPVYAVELRLQCKDGSYKWILCRGTVVKRDDDGKPMRMIGIHSDISERKHAEHALQESQAKLQSLFELSPLGIALTDMRGNFLEFNKSFENITGYSTEELHDLDYWALTPNEYEKQEAKQLEQLNSSGCYGPYEKNYRRKNGDLIPVRLNGMLMKNQNGESQIWSIVEDISISKRDETRRQGNNKILEMIAKGDALAEVLEAVVLHAETVLSGGTCSILLADSSGSYLGDGVAPSMPDFYNEAIDGLEIGMGIGSCGEAAFSGKRVIVADVKTHPNWTAFRDMAQKAGMQACWSEPFFSISGEVIGTFAIYYPTIREPLDEELILTGELAKFVAIVVERTHVQQALVDAKVEAENANIAKSQFLSNMSHELRTPMNAIMGFGQLLNMETDPALVESQQENVDEIMKASKHLLEIINQVLDLSRIEAGRIDLSVEAVEIDEVINESVQLIMPLAKKRGIEISKVIVGAESIDGKLLNHSVVSADRIRLKQVLLNLLSNAVKYNAENGKIIITCNHVSDKKIRVSITDTGAGLTPQQQSQLFKTFNRLVSNQSDIEGTGIGLALSKSIIELMDGRVGVDSQCGEGSTFWIELPVATLPSARGGMSGEEEVMESSVIADTEHEYTVLYIEDNPANLQLVHKLLDRYSNIFMWSAHTPLLGLELAAIHKPDLILLDINLPGMDGYEVLSLLRQSEGCANIPVIAVSANAIPKDIERGLAAGFDDYITKPIDVNDFLHAVNAVLRRGE